MLFKGFEFWPKTREASGESPSPDSPEMTLPSAFSVSRTSANSPGQVGGESILLRCASPEACPELAEWVTPNDHPVPLFVIPGLTRNPVFLSLKDQKITLLEQRVIFAMRHACLLEASA